jgi:hypothetical protein
MAPRRTLVFDAARIGIGALLFVLSLLTLAQTEHHVRVLAFAEAVCAFLFVVPQTMVAGGWGLLGVLGIATATHLHSDGAAGSLPVYMMMVILVLAHRVERREP